MSFIHHIGITCSDIQKSKEFYCDYLGLEVSKDQEVPADLMKTIFNIDSPARLIHLKSGSGIIELFDFKNVKEYNKNIPNNSGISHFALYVDDRESVRNRFEDMGLKTIKVEKDNGEFVYFVKDPDGVLIELRE